MDFYMHNKNKDYLYNILASMLLTIALQLFVYPTIAIQETTARYGEILIIMAIVNIIIVSLGNTLNNIRLIVNADYEAEKIKGDFKVLLGVAVVCSFAVSIVASTYVDISMSDSLIIALITALGSVKAYVCVEYRLKIDFVKVFRLNAVTSIIYLIATYGYSAKFMNWIYIFLLTEICSTIYLYYTLSFILQEPAKITYLFVSTLKKYILLTLIGLVANTIVYLDRILIFPMLGAEVVAIYFCASFLGKSLGIIVVPISGVLLSYYSLKKNLTKAQFIHNVTSYTVTCVAFYFLLQLASHFIIPRLYPSLYHQAKEYIWLGNLASIILVLSSIINPAILKFVKLGTQLYASIFHIIFYMITAYFLTDYFGLIGFCYAAIASNLAKILIQVSIGLKALGYKVNHNI